jgi:HEAT repeat protein
MTAEFRESLKHYTPEQNYDIALHNENADARRRAINRIVQSGHATDGDAFRVLDVAARTDPNAQVRCAAILALKNYWDARPIGTLLAILNPRAHPNESAPASPAVRWDATAALGRFAEGALIPGDRRDEVVDVLVATLLHDPYRDAKMAAARGLGSIPDKRVLRALIASLRHRNFGIAYEAHASLVRLTGQPYQYDVGAWEAWLNSATNPFDHSAKAAAPSPTTQPAG